MRKTIPILITVMVVMVSMTGSAVAFTASNAQANPIEQTTELNQTQTNQSNESVPPGVMLAGSVAVQHEEFQGEMEQRSFGLQMAQAANNDSRAQVLNHTQEELDERLEEIEERKQELNESLAEGEISQTQHDVEMTRLVAQSSNLERLANSSATVAHGMSNETLESNGVNVTALEHVRNNARNMHGQEVSEMARQIGGPHGNADDRRRGPPEGMGHGPPEDRDDDDNETDDGDDRRMGPPMGDDNETDDEDDRRMGPPMGDDDETDNGDERQRGPGMGDDDETEDNEDVDNTTTTTTETEESDDSEDTDDETSTETTSNTTATDTTQTTTGQ